MFFSLISLFSSGPAQGANKPVEDERGWRLEGGSNSEGEGWGLGVG